MTMRAGRLNKRITFYSIDDDYDSFGELTKTKTKLSTVWAEVLASESLITEGSFAQEQNKVKVTIRYNQKLEQIPKTRLVIEYQGKEFYPTSRINQKMLNETLVIEAINRG